MNIIKTIFCTAILFGEPVPVPKYAEEEYGYAKLLGGSCLDETTQELVPLDPDSVDKAFDCTKNLFTEQIGELQTRWDSVPLNTATKAERLSEDAEAVSYRFQKGCEQIAKECGGQANFGPEDRFLLKKKESLKNKIERDSITEGIPIETATAKIGDALRGTIILETVEQLQQTIQKIEDWVERERGAIVWKNTLEEARDDGYVGVHGKMSLAYSDKWGTTRSVRAELQLHFRSITDGSLSSRKERMHQLYKSAPSSNSSANEQTSRLSFFSGLASVGDTCRTPASLLQQCNGEVAPVNLCEETPRFCMGNLGLSRSDMPQLRGSVKDRYLQKKKKQVLVKDERIRASELTPTQVEINQEQVDRLTKSFRVGLFDPCDKPILVSGKNENGTKYILDGHHRYAACRSVGGFQNVTSIYDSVKNLLSEMTSFPGVTRSSLAEAATRKH